MRSNTPCPGRGTMLSLSGIGVAGAVDRLSWIHADSFSGPLLVLTARYTEIRLHWGTGVGILVQSYCHYRLVWRGPAYALLQVSTDVFTTKSCDCGGGKSHARHLAISGSSQGYACLEDEVWKDVSDNEVSVTGGALASIPSLVYNFWTDLLETMSLDTQSTPWQWLPLSQQMQRSLERNHMADLKPRSEARYWQKLLDRLERRERLAQQLGPLSFKIENPAQDPMPARSIKIESTPNQRPDRL